MSTDYIALLVITIIGGVIGLYALYEAKKYRTRKLADQVDTQSSHITLQGKIFEDFGITPEEVEKFKSADLIRVTAKKRSGAIK